MSRRITSLLGVVALTLPLAMAPSGAEAAGPPNYTVRFLQPTGGHESTVGADINSAGDVVGTSVTEQFQIDPGGTITSWRAGNWAPFQHSGNAMGEGVAIADNGTIVASTYPAGFTQGRVYPRGDAVGREIVAPSEDDDVVLKDIAANGAYVGVSPWDTANGWVWYPDGRTAEVGNVSAISPNARHIVSGDGASGVVVRSDGSQRTLPLPSGYGRAFGQGVNDSGVVAGSVAVSPDAALGADTRAVQWSATGSPTVLPNAGGFTHAWAADVNASGVVVGRSYTGNKGTATVWHAGVAYDLNTRLVANHDRYTLDSAHAINAKGQIVGTATLSDGTTRAYVATPLAAGETVDVYTTPGEYTVNGRRWTTTCEPYSQTERCRTNIWSTVVSYTGGKFVSNTGWNFNNLTYLPSSRSLWKDNPLATAGEHTVSGRRWKTECNTPQTGGNGCRSYIWTGVVSANRSASGTTYSVANQWVFNNIVRFK